MDIEGVRIFFLDEGRGNRRSKTFSIIAEQKFDELNQQDHFQIVHSLDRTALPIAKKKRNHNVVVAYDVEATQMSQLFAILGMAKETAGSLFYTYIALTYIILT